MKRKVTFGFGYDSVNDDDKVVTVASLRYEGLYDDSNQADM